ncbi:AsmA family protein [Brucella sp. BE17]|uniref:AsmA family protein n=1 Tax=Brucella sp. BE17 TaxID=3142977 RepID=UPI0031B9F0BC
MSRIFVIIGGFLVLLLTAALVVPPFVDWGGYRADFEREASRVLGRPVKVAGDVSARLLPFPSVTFADVRVGADEAQPVMTVDTFSMDAELMPFLRGQLLIFDMRVERPRATIALGQDGKVDWAIRPTTPLDPAQIKVERLSVEDGAITLHDQAKGRTIELTAFNAVMSANSLAGPWKADSDFKLEGRAFKANLTSGEAKPDGSLRLRLRLSPQAIPGTLETDGDVVLNDGRLSYSGDFSLRSADMVAQVGKGPKEPTEKPFFSDLRVNGKFNADADRFDASEFRMEQGPVDNPYVVNGKALLDYGLVPHFEVSADGQQIFWGRAEVPEDEKAKAVPLADRFDTLHRILEQLPVPAMPGRIDLRLPAVIAGGTTIRSVTINAEPDAGDWNILQFSADLPGRTKVEAKGKLSVGDEFGFTGDMLVASRQPSGLAGWLNERVDDSIRTLDRAGFSGKVNLRRGIQRIDDLEIGLGGTTLKGSLSRETRSGAEPVVDISLSGQAVQSEALQATFTLFSGGEGLALLNTQALNLSFKAGPVDYQDIQARNVDLAVRLHDGRFDFDRLMISDVAGATLTATGTYEPFANMPSGSLDATILSEDLSRFVSLMANRYPQLPLFRVLSVRAADFPGLFEDSEINVIANATAPNRQLPHEAIAKNNAAREKTARPSENRSKMPAGNGELSFSVTGKTGAMTLELSGTASGGEVDTDPLQMQLNGSATSSEGEAVLALIGFRALPLGLAGELTADLTMQGAPSAGMRTLLKLTAPDGTASADGVISLVGEDIAASGKATVNAADLQPFIATVGYALPGYGAGLPVDLSSDFQFAKGILRFPNLAGKLGGEDISARLEANLADSGLPLLKGEAKIALLEAGSIAAIMLGDEALEAARPSAKSIWPQIPFSARPSLPLLLDMKLNASQMHMGGFGEVSEFSTRLQKTMDGVSLNEITGHWEGGYLTGNLSLRNSDKNALLTTDMKWSGASLADFYRLENGSTPLGGTVKASLALNGSGENASDLVGSLAGAGTFDVEDFTVDGLDAGALPEMLATSDAISEEPASADKMDAARFAAVTEKAVGQGRFAPGNARFDFTIAGGIARLPMVELSEGNTRLQTTLQVDLTTLGLGGGGAFILQNEAAAQAGFSPEVTFTLDGTYDAPNVHIDRQPLAQFLAQRVLKREQERVETMQASLMEKQRLRRELGLFEAGAAERRRVVAEAEARRLRNEQQKAQRPASGEVGEPLSPSGQSVEDFIKSLRPDQ